MVTHICSLLIGTLEWGVSCLRNSRHTFICCTIRSISIPCVPIATCALIFRFITMMLCRRRERGRDFQAIDNFLRIAVFFMFEIVSWPSISMLLAFLENIRIIRVVMNRWRDGADITNIRSWDDWSLMVGSFVLLRRAGRVLRLAIEETHEMIMPRIRK